MKTKKLIAACLAAGSLSCAGTVAFVNYAYAASETVQVELHKVSTAGVGESIGTISFTDTDAGLSIKPNLKSLSPGPHGFHVHENATCEAALKDGVMTAAQAAGGHFDPNKTGKHMGPNGHGHEGDLPVLEVAADGTATKEFFLKDSSVAMLKNHAVMIHAGGDNYSDTPKPLGGGEGRIACGVVPH